MFASDQQRARFCQAICDAVYLDGMWTADGPTEKNLRFLRAHGGTLSSGEWIVLQVAWDVWGGHGQAKLYDVIDRLDSNILEVLGWALVALAGGSQQIEAFIQAGATHPFLSPGNAPPLRHTATENKGERP